MSNLEYFKSLFDREQVRKVELNNEINIPIGIITLISGGVILVFKEAVTSLCSLSFLMIVVIGSLLMASVLYLAKSYNNLFKGFKYKYLPDSMEMYKHKKDLENFNRKVKKAEQECFKDYLIENYASLNSTNMKINRSRLQYLYVAKTMVIIALILTMTLMFLYMVNSLNH